METRDEILLAISPLFLRYGIKSITMDDIAKHLSISKKTIYLHFKDKDELVEEFVKVVDNDHEHDMLKIKKEAVDVMDELTKISEFMRNKVCNINQSVLFDLKKYHPKAYMIFHHHKKNFMINFVLDTIKKGINEGYFRKNVNPEIFAILRLEQVEMSFNPDIFPPDKYNVNELHIQLFEHFIYGICTTEGFEKFMELRNSSAWK
ncbi:MAG: TetR/AcrR family transcriptional regulator [Cytophagales bacterium]|nr:TetR/AcrR family transcriptional regulator [Cytophagales bacterium]